MYRRLRQCKTLHGITQRGWRNKPKFHFNGITRGRVPIMSVRIAIVMHIVKRQNIRIEYYNVANELKLDDIDYSPLWSHDYVYVHD